jgi:FkbM family methyltransferase
MINAIAKFARLVTGPFVFNKRLPSDFGRQKVLVTTRSDIRVLAPGLNSAAGDLFRVVRKYVSVGHVVWDIGSNLGILSFSAAMKCGPSGRVFSLEADPRYAEIQNRTLRKLSSRAGRVTVLCAAVANKVGLLELVIPKKGHARNHLSVVDGNSPGDAEAAKQVVSVTLDFLLDHWAPPNFLKIDVEGAELLAMEGATRLFEKIRPVTYIECSPENSPQLTDFFRRMNYSLFWLDEAGQEKPVDTCKFNTVAKPN